MHNRWKIKLKRVVCYLVIVVLLPYIITVFLNGSKIHSASHVDEMLVYVKQKDAVIELPLSEYGIGILAKEILPSYQMEALKAQAVLVRTNIYRNLQQGTDSILEETFWDREQMKAAWGSTEFSKNYKRLEEAWKKTRGKILTYQDVPAMTPFFRLSNGSTRDGQEVLGSGDYPYLKIVECPLDVEDKDQIRTEVLEDMDVEVTEYDTAGYVKTVRVGNESVNGEEFRTNYHLASSSFTVQKYQGKLRITTRGIGHGLGMSQNTAQKMAEQGSKMTEILNYFFEGTNLKTIAEIIQ